MHLSIKEVFEVLFPIDDNNLAQILKIAGIESGLVPVTVEQGLTMEKILKLFEPRRKTYVITQGTLKHIEATASKYCWPTSVLIWIVVRSFVTENEGRLHILKELKNDIDSIWERLRKFQLKAKDLLGDDWNSDPAFARIDDLEFPAFNGIEYNFEQMNIDEEIRLIEDLVNEEEREEELVHRQRLIDLMQQASK